MIRRFTAAFALFAVLFVTAFASAQDGSSDPVLPEQVINIGESELIDGVVLRPDGMFVVADDGTEGHSLIPIRLNFIPQMIASVNLI